MSEVLTGGCLPLRGGKISCFTFFLLFSFLEADNYGFVLLCNKKTFFIFIFFVKILKTDLNLTSQFIGPSVCVCVHV